MPLLFHLYLPRMSAPTPVDLKHVLQGFAVQTEEERAEDRTMAFMMCTNLRLGSHACAWVHDLPTEVFSVICVPRACASSERMSVLQARILHWGQLFEMDSAPFQSRLWARMLELQRLLNHCCEKQRVTLTLFKGPVRERWQVPCESRNSWFGWTTLRILNPQCFYEDVVAMMDAQPGLWKVGFWKVGRTPPSRVERGRTRVIRNVFRQLQIMPSGRKRPPQEIAFTDDTHLLQHEEFAYLRFDMYV